MVTNNDIADAIAALVERKFPGESVYRDFTPANFERPSTLVELSGGKFYPNFGCGTVELRPQFTLTTFVPANAYHQPETVSELTRRQMILLGLFLPGYVKVKDRAPHVMDGGELINGLDYAAVTVTFSYTLSREEFEQISAQAPMMERLHIRQEVQTYG